MIRKNLYRRLQKSFSNRFSILKESAPRFFPEQSHFHPDRMKWFFEKVGGNFDDPVQMGVLSGFLSNIILAHFENKYVWEQVKKAVGESRKIEEKTFDEQVKMCCVDEDDYYNKYAETLAKIYFHGVPSVTTISKNKEKK